jgi:HJR/Mrr/RecB family endonuclease
MFFKNKQKTDKSFMHFSKEGLMFVNPLLSAQSAYLEQLAEIGVVAFLEGRYFLSWEAFYELADDAEHIDSLSLLDLPKWSEASPILVSNGALIDSSFQINLDGWREPMGGRLRSVVRWLYGGVLEVDGQKKLLRKPSWALVDAVMQFASLLNEQRTTEINYQRWGLIRRLAIAANANLDNFLTKTIVLTPDTLNLELERLENQAIRIAPQFQDAPANWLERFDRLASIPDYYNISLPEGGQMHIAITDPVKKVLREIKRMPGRIARGKRAQAFIRNPYAVLGEEVKAVIPPESYEASLRHADIVFYTFEIAAKKDGKGNILSVSLELEATRSGAIPAYERYTFDSPNTLSRLIDEIQRQLQDGYPCFNWQGYEVELRGDAEDKLRRLHEWYERWLHPIPAITYEDIYEFPDYAQRVIEISERNPYYSPFIIKKEPNEPWLPANTLIGIGSASDNTPLIAFEPEQLEQFADAVTQAKAEGKETIEYPGLSQPMPIQEAEVMIPLIQGVINATRSGTQLPAMERTTFRQARKGLNIITNIESGDYTEGRLDDKRTQRLAFDKSRADGLMIPSALRAELKTHQTIGIAWLQHLWRNSPKFCSGCLMADDMGLGKTLQLLTFIAWYLEKPNALPVLIVAPVSLLENWQNEIKKFFAPGFFRVLTLYGKTLAEKKVSQSAIDQRLLDEGLTRFLVDDWLDNANLVLTTFETLRDLSISLGQQDWGIMVCDEAQKIKTPGALVTDAAKAQKVEFKIACTGTPVENSLTDLWCLFDFIQPGLLGPLNRFGLNYRRPIENASGDDEQKAALDSLRQLINPQLLRRTKREVAKDLPIKFDDGHEHIREINRIPLNDYQRRLYQEAITDYQRLKGAAANSAQRTNPILTVLHRLRAICADPRPNGLQPDLGLSVIAYRKQSPKFNWLIERLDEIQRKREKVLIFTEYLDLQRALQHYLRLNYKLGPVWPRIINGSVKSGSEATESRQKFIDEFQAYNGFNILILSPKAAGFGLNIQAANHVIHYTRPWNPAVEDQATDRAYRIGQTRDVYVYYPTVCTNENDFVTVTFEAKLDALLREKRALAGDMLNGVPTVTQDELTSLVLGEDQPEDGSKNAVQIKEEHLSRIIGVPFEKLCRELWIRQGYRCLTTQPTRDGGVDIVAIKGNHGLLIQCKSSGNEKGLGWNAINEVVGGAAAYEQQFPQVKFNKVAVTNQVFNDNAIRLAELNVVTLIDRSVLSEWLAQCQLTFEVLVD